MLILLLHIYFLPHTPGEIKIIISKTISPMNGDLSGLTLVAVTHSDGGFLSRMWRKVGAITLVYTWNHYHSATIMW